MVSFSLGQRVRFTGIVKKVNDASEEPDVLATTSYLELPNPWVSPTGGEKYQASEGVIVGRRYVADYRKFLHRSYALEGYFQDTEIEWSRVEGTARRVWLIAFDLGRKHVMAYDHQVEAL